MAELEIQLLGRFSARRSGEEISPASFGGRLARMLVRVLVTRRGSFVSRDVLAEALWPERMPADPTTNLRVLVQRARAALGDPALIITGPGGYSFTAGGGCEVDSELFVAGVQAGHDRMVTGQAGAALAAFRAALERWAGEPLAEDVYEDWATAPRATLWRAHLQALEEGAEAALALRDPGQAVVLAERAVAREPLREPAALLLAGALAASGDQVAALRTIDSLRRRLAEEVGLALSPEALALETRLQRGEGPTEPSRRPVVMPAVRGAFDGLSFVGREDELHTLLDAVSGSEPGIVLVAGSGGMGKSRFLAEAAARSEVPVLTVRAFLPERNEPWSLARALLREALALDLEAARAVPDRAAQALTDVLPELEELRPMGDVVVDPQSRRALALEAAVRVTGAAVGQGALVIIDDLQWADATSLAVLGLISRRVRSAGLVLAYRPEEAAVDTPPRTFIDELRAVRPPVEISLGPLTREDISQVVADVTLAGVIAEETDRAPLTVTETVRSLSAERIIEPNARGRWEARRPDAVPLAREVARAGQRRAIVARADRQPSDRKELLSLLALLGREAPARIVARAVTADEAKVLDDLDRLARAGLARLGDGGWAPAHDVIGEVVSEGLDRAERGRLHHLLARALEAEGGDPAEVASHLSGAGDKAAAAAAFAAAAEQRLLAFAADEAGELAASGLSLDAPPEVRVTLLRARAEARALQGDLTGARDDLRSALPSIPRSPERSRALVRIAELTSALDDYRQADELIEVALAEAAGDRAARAEALVVAAIFDTNRGDLQHAEKLVVEALALFESLEDPAGIASVLDARSLVLFCRGRFAESADLLDRVARLYRDCGRLLKVGTTRVGRGWMLALQNRAEEGLHELDQALELERTLGQSEGEAFGLWARSEVLSILGRTEEARADAEAGIALSQAVGNRELVGYALRALARAHVTDGDLQPAETALRQALEVAGDVPIVAATCASQLASVLVARGDLDAAEGYAAESLRLGIGLADYEANFVLAEVALERGAPDAEQRAALALERATAGGYFASPTRARLEARAPAPSEATSPAPSRRRERRTFMFTDIVQSTNLVETLGDEAWGHLLRWHDQTLRALFAAHHGEEINRIGDGFFVAFERPRDGVRCAVEIQRALERHRVEHGFAPGVRIGLHQAEATRDGDDYQGRGVHEAARIGALAEGGQILASVAAVDDPALVATSPPRTLALRGLSEPVEVVCVEWQS